MQYPSSLEVFHLVKRIDPAQHLDLFLAAIFAGDYQGQVHSRLQFAAGQAEDIQGFLARQVQALAVLVELELQGQYAHTHQVGAVDTLEALGNHRLDPQQVGALGGPVTA